MTLSTIEQRLTDLSNKLDLFINGQANETVNTSSGAVRTLAGIQEELFRTRALVECKEYDLLADLPDNASLNTVARVSKDGNNNGLYIRRIGEWGLYNWQDIQYFVPTQMNQNEYKHYFSSSNLNLGTNIVQSEIPHSTVKNTLMVYDIEIVTWQNVSTVSTPSAELVKFLAIATSRDSGELHFNISQITKTSLGAQINLQLQGVSASANSNNVFTLRLTALGNIPDVFGVATITARRFDGQV